MSFYICRDNRPVGRTVYDTYNEAWVMLAKSCPAYSVSHAMAHEGWSIEEGERRDVLCGCGWGELGRIVADGELIHCPQCGFTLGEECL